MRSVTGIAIAVLVAGAASLSVGASSSRRAPAPDIAPIVDAMQKCQPQLIYDVLHEQVSDGYDSSGEHPTPDRRRNVIWSWANSVGYVPGACRQILKNLRHGLHSEVEGYYCAPALVCQTPEIWSFHEPERALLLKPKAPLLDADGRPVPRRTTDPLVALCRPSIDFPPGGERVCVVDGGQKRWVPRDDIHFDTEPIVELKAENGRLLITGLTRPD